MRKEYAGKRPVKEQTNQGVSGEWGQGSGKRDGPEGLPWGKLPRGGKKKKNELVSKRRNTASKPLGRQPCRLGLMTYLNIGEKKRSPGQGLEKKHPVT